MAWTVRERRGRGPGKPPFVEVVVQHGFVAEMNRLGCFARVSYRRGKQRLADGIALNSDEMKMPPEMVAELIEVRFQIAIASCEAMAQTGSERARKARVRRCLKGRA